MYVAKSLGVKIYAQTCASSTISFMLLIGLNTHDRPYVNETMVSACVVICNVSSKGLVVNINIRRVHII